MRPSITTITYAPLTFALKREILQNKYPFLWRSSYTWMKCRRLGLMTSHSANFLKLVLTFSSQQVPQHNTKKTTNFYIVWVSRWHALPCVVIKSIWRPTPALGPSTDSFCSNSVFSTFGLSKSFTEMPVSSCGKTFLSFAGCKSRSYESIALSQFIWTWSSVDDSKQLRFVCAYKSTGIFHCPRGEIYRKK